MTERIRVIIRKRRGSPSPRHQKRSNSKKRSNEPILIKSSKALNDPPQLQNVVTRSTPSIHKAAMEAAAEAARAAARVAATAAASNSISRPDLRSPQEDYARKLEALSQSPASRIEIVASRFSIRRTRFSDVKRVKSEYSNKTSRTSLQSYDTEDEHIYPEKKAKTVRIASGGPLQSFDVIQLNPKNENPGILKSSRAEDKNTIATQTKLLVTEPTSSQSNNKPEPATVSNTKEEKNDKAETTIANEGASSSGSGFKKTVVVDTKNFEIRKAPDINRPGFYKLSLINKRDVANTAISLKHSNSEVLSPIGVPQHEKIKNASNKLVSNIRKPEKYDNIVIDLKKSEEKINEFVWKRNFSRSHGVYSSHAKKPENLVIRLSSSASLHQNNDTKKDVKKDDMNLENIKIKIPLKTVDSKRKIEDGKKGIPLEVKKSVESQKVPQSKTQLNKAQVHKASSNTNSNLSCKRCDSSPRKELFKEVPSRSTDCVRLENSKNIGVKPKEISNEVVFLEIKKSFENMVVPLKPSNVNEAGEKNVDLKIDLPSRTLVNLKVPIRSSTNIQMKTNEKSDQAPKIEKGKEGLTLHIKKSVDSLIVNLWNVESNKGKTKISELKDSHPKKDKNQEFQANAIKPLPPAKKIENKELSKPPILLKQNIVSGKKIVNNFKPIDCIRKITTLVNQNNIGKSELPKTYPLKQNAINEKITSDKKPDPRTDKKSSNKANLYGGKKTTLPNKNVLDPKITDQLKGTYEVLRPFKGVPQQKKETINVASIPSSPIKAQKDNEVFNLPEEQKRTQDRPNNPHLNQNSTNMYKNTCQPQKKLINAPKIDAKKVTDTTVLGLKNFCNGDVENKDFTEFCSCTSSSKESSSYCQCSSCDSKPTTNDTKLESLNKTSACSCSCSCSSSSSSGSCTCSKCSCCSSRSQKTDIKENNEKKSSSENFYCTVPVIADKGEAKITAPSVKDSSPSSSSCSDCTNVASVKCVCDVCPNPCLKDCDPQKPKSDPKADKQKIDSKSKRAAVPECKCDVCPTPCLKECDPLKPADDLPLVPKCKCDICPTPCLKECDPLRPADDPPPIPKCKCDVCPIPCLKECDPQSPAELKKPINEVAPAPKSKCECDSKKRKGLKKPIEKPKDVSKGECDLCLSPCFKECDPLRPDPLKQNIEELNNAPDPGMMCPVVKPEIILGVKTIPTPQGKAPIHGPELSDSFTLSCECESSECLHVSRKQETESESSTCDCTKSNSCNSDDTNNKELPKEKGDILSTPKPNEDCKIIEATENIGESVIKACEQVRTCACLVCPQFCAPEPRKMVPSLTIHNITNIVECVHNSLRDLETTQPDEKKCEKPPEKPIATKPFVLPCKQPAGDNLSQKGARNKEMSTKSSAASCTRSTPDNASKKPEKTKEICTQSSVTSSQKPEKTKEICTQSSVTSSQKPEKTKEISTQSTPVSCKQPISEKKESCKQPTPVDEKIEKKDNSPDVSKVAIILDCKNSEWLRQLLQDQNEKPVENDAEPPKLENACNCKKVEEEVEKELPDVDNLNDNTLPKCTKLAIYIEEPISITKDSKKKPTKTVKKRSPPRSRSPSPAHSTSSGKHVKKKDCCTFTEATVGINTDRVESDSSCSESSEDSVLINKQLKDVCTSITVSEINDYVKCTCNSKPDRQECPSNHKEYAAISSCPNSAKKDVCSTKMPDTKSKQAPEPCKVEPKSKKSPDYNMLQEHIVYEGNCENDKTDVKNTISVTLTRTSIKPIEISQSPKIMSQKILFDTCACLPQGNIAAQFVETKNSKSPKILEFNCKIPDEKTKNIKETSACPAKSTKSNNQQQDVCQPTQKQNGPEIATDVLPNNPLPCPVKSIQQDPDESILDTCTCTSTNTDFTSSPEKPIQQDSGDSSCTCTTTDTSSSATSKCTCTTSSSCSKDTEKNEEPTACSETDPAAEMATVECELKMLVEKSSKPVKMVIRTFSANIPEVDEHSTSCPQKLSGTCPSKISAPCPPKSSPCAKDTQSRNKLFIETFKELSTASDTQCTCKLCTAQKEELKKNKSRKSPKICVLPAVSIPPTNVVCAYAYIDTEQKDENTKPNDFVKTPVNVCGFDSAHSPLQDSNWSKTTTKSDVSSSKNSSSRSISNNEKQCFFIMKPHQSKSKVSPSKSHKNEKNKNNQPSEKDCIFLLKPQSNRNDNLRHVASQQTDTTKTSNSPSIKPAYRAVCDCFQLTRPSQKTDNFQKHSSKSLCEQSPRKPILTRHYSEPYQITFNSYTTTISENESSVSKKTESSSLNQKSCQTSATTLKNTKESKNATIDTPHYDLLRIIQDTHYALGFVLKKNMPITEQCSNDRNRKSSGGVSETDAIRTSSYEQSVDRTQSIEQSVDRTSQTVYARAKGSKTSHVEFASDTYDKYEDKYSGSKSYNGTDSSGPRISITSSLQEVRSNSLYRLIDSIPEVYQSDTESLPIERISNTQMSVDWSVIQKEIELMEVASPISNKHTSSSVQHVVHETSSEEPEVYPVFEEEMLMKENAPKEPYFKDQITMTDMAGILGLTETSVEKISIESQTPRSPKKTLVRTAMPTQYDYQVEAVYAHQINPNNLQTINPFSSQLYEPEKRDEIDDLRNEIKRITDENRRYSNNLRAYVEEVILGMKEVRTKTVDEKLNEAITNQALKLYAPNKAEKPDESKKDKKIENSFPVTIQSVRPLGKSSLIVQWTVKDPSNVGGYEVSVDGKITNRYYSNDYMSCVVFNVNILSKHILILNAFPKCIKHHVDNFKLNNGQKSTNSNSLSKRTYLCDPSYWTPSCYFYKPNNLPTINLKTSGCN